jgi:transposase
VIRAIANSTLKSLSGEFQKLYSLLRRESIPPERLLRALLLQAFYSIRSERQLVERIDHHPLFHWFVGLGSRTRCGTPPPSPRTAAGCWKAMWRPSFSPRC